MEKIWQQVYIGQIQEWVKDDTRHTLKDWIAMPYHIPVLCRTLKPYAVFFHFKHIRNHLLQKRHDRCPACQNDPVNGHPRICCPVETPCFRSLKKYFCRVPETFIILCAVSSKLQSMQSGKT